MSRWLIATRVAYDRNNPNPNKKEVINKASQEDAYWMMRDKYITRDDGDLFYTLLHTQDTNIKVGAQNMNAEEKGAFTGEVSRRNA